jgi:hypothetical protein
MGPPFAFFKESFIDSEVKYLDAFSDWFTSLNFVDSTEDGVTSFISSLENWNKLNYDNFARLLPPVAHLTSEDFMMNPNEINQFLMKRKKVLAFKSFKLRVKRNLKF